MRRKSYGVPLLALAVLTATAVGLDVVTTSGRSARDENVSAQGDVPTALANHLERLKQAIPGNGGESSEGPSAAADYAFEQRAYPDDAISLAEINRATSAAKALQKQFPTGKGKPGTWVSVGPKDALYPFTDLRDLTSYVPNAYSAGGRTNAIAIAPNCKPGNCRMWIGPAGGGLWRTDNALADPPVHWTYLGMPFGINAMGAITVDPNDPTGSTVWVGTGEANICGSGCVAGAGLYKSTDGGATWNGPIGASSFAGKGVSSIVFKPGQSNTIYVGSTTALRGMSSVCCSGVTRPVPGAAQWGLYKSTDGGVTWAFIHNGGPDASLCTPANQPQQFANLVPECSPRGVDKVELDPSNPDNVYAASFGRGIWRSSDAGTTWTQIKTPLSTAIQNRTEFATTKLGSGDTRMYVAEGNTGAQYSRVFRSDSVASGSPTFTQLTSTNVADDGWATFNYCRGQCWYDNFVYTPQGYPDIVYVGGSYAYGELRANHRAVLLSTDAGATFTDMTADATDPIHPNALHPDQHSIVTNPSNPYQFFEGSDGGVMRSSGAFTDVSSWCDSRGLSATSTARCKQMLSRVPTQLDGLNKGLSTLQFQSLSVSPFDVNELQGGTQDNGTWENYGSPSQWINTMIGDGGQSGFDVADPHFRFHNFFDASPDVNFSDGAMADWNWIGDPIFGTGAQFYAPMISDPKVSGTMFTGTANVWRTKTHGMGSMTLADFRAHCNEWTGDFTVQCGDWEQIASPALTSDALGDRAGGSVVAVERTSADTSTAWAATQTGRLFISKNGDADPASAVTWNRIDTASTPNRFVSSIYVSPTDPNLAWISYSGFNSATPATPGHVLKAIYDPVTGTATFTDLSYDFGDIPVTDLVDDDVTGDLYASTDFGVYRLAGGATSWTLAAPGMPSVEAAGLTIIPAKRKLYAATHGLGAWSLNLP
jgi:hypothetical protein